MFQGFGITQTDVKCLFMSNSYLVGISTFCCEYQPDLPYKQLHIRGKAACFKVEKIDLVIKPSITLAHCASSRSLTTLYFFRIGCDHVDDFVASIPLLSCELDSPPHSASGVVVRNSHRLSSLPTYNTNLTTSGTFFPC
jgi:hypothetical protein